MGWTPRHLWTGEWRSESERARAAAAEAAAERRFATRPHDLHAADETSEPAERPFSRNVLATMLALAAITIAAVAFAAGTLLEQGNGNSKAPAPLPAVASKPIKPHQGQTRAGAIYAAASPAVVSVRTNGSEGTGFVISRAGMIVTNDHVVENSSHVLVRFGANGAAIDGDVLGTDPSSDLAVIGIDPQQLPREAKPLQFADSRAVQIGDLAIAIGNPFGLDRTATQGIVSGIGRSIQSPNGFTIDQVIQTDAPINPGNSGGPLLDDGGHVIGVNAQIATGGGGGNVGIGFAIPSNTVRQVVPLLERGKRVPHAWLGVRNASGPGGGTTGAAPGAQVVQVVPGSPGDRAGIRPGDVIARIDGHAVQDAEDLSAQLAGHRPGDTVTLQLQRGGQTVTLHVKLGTQPARTP
jgi:S1-C subfamily serine protease